MLPAALCATVWEPEDICGCLQKLETLHEEIKKGWRAAQQQGYEHFYLRQRIKYIARGVLSSERTRPYSIHSHNLTLVDLYGNRED